MRRVILAICCTVAGLVLLLGYKSQSAPAVTKPLSASAAGPSSTSSSAGPSTGSGGSGSSGSSSGPGTSPNTSPTASPSSSTTGTKSATGDAADTRYGPVQVEVTVVDGKITTVEAVEYPQTGALDRQINSVAIPQLNQEALAVGTASIDHVSGATYTSDGYVQSLQSALDKLK